MVMVEAVRTSETSVYFKETTRRCIAEGCNLRNRRCKNLKSQASACDWSLKIKHGIGLKDVLLMQITFQYPEKILSVLSMYFALR
jgi:hypothetical protein